MIENECMENPQFRKDGKGDFSTSERVFNNNETHLEAVVNCTTYDVSRDSSFKNLNYQEKNQILPGIW